MSAVEEIEAAIALLTKLKADSAPGPWQHWAEAGTVEIYTDAPHPTSRSSEYVIASQVCPRLGYGGEIYVDNYEPNAELIVTLHRTLGAQLDWLRTARGFYGAGITGPETATLFAEHALQLARAINGATS